MNKPVLVWFKNNCIYFFNTQKSKLGHGHVNKFL